jgi:hypothetical protein
MKIKKLLLIAAVIAASVTSSMAQWTVYSLNVVGYVNVVLVGGGYSLINNPLDTGTNTYDNLFGSGSPSPFPAGVSIMKWDPINAQFITVTRTSFNTHWNPSAAGTNLANPGTGLFIHVTGDSITNTFVGTVLQGLLTNSFSAGYNLVGNQAPVGGTVTNVGLTNVPSGTLILQWDPIGQQYLGHTRTGVGIGWNPPTVPTFEVAEGFFVNTPTAFNWVQDFIVQ